MSLLNPTIKGYLANSSMIRRMFEAGIELKKQYGADKVYDFSLGNPDLPPPAEVKSALEKITATAGDEFAIGYMPNAGYPALREALAERISMEQGVKINGASVLVTCGAAGGLNVLLRSILTPGSEVVAPSPYFVEYDFYVANAGGKLVTAPSRDFTFELDIEAFEKAITANTKAIILNSPNNPTGRIYTREELTALASVISAAEKKYNTTITVISDEPYRFLNFENAEIPGFFGIFPNSVIIGSFSKNLSLAGERLGYIAIAPTIAEHDDLMAALILCNRILGFVNAPAIGQKILLECLNSQVDLDVYRRRRQAMAEALDGANLKYFMPHGAFYFFLPSPVEDERVFVDALLKERILAVPGRGFGRAGYVRLAFCVDEKIIRNSAPGFAAAVASLKNN